MSEYIIEIYSNTHRYQLACGEQAYFFPYLSCDGWPVREGTAEWILRKDNETEIARGTVDIANHGEGCAGTLEEPGFLECEYIYTAADGSQAIHKMAVGFDADKIEPSTECPDDFNAFWDSQLERLAQVPVKAVETVISDALVTLSDVQIDCVDDIPVSGHLARPKGADKQSCAIILTVQGAGVRSAQFQQPCQHAMQQCIAMNINAHGIENDRDGAFYQELAENTYEGYPRWGLDGPPEKAYFCNMFLRVRRALDYLCEDPLWDGKNVWITGGSQGALQSFAGAYLDKRVTAMAVGVPAGSDLTGFAIDRVTGWPRPDLLFLEGDSTKEAVLQTAPYFDNVNFARHITVPMMMSVGFVDLTCKPTTVYAVYNAFNGPKQILDKPRMGHEGGFDIGQEFLSFLMSQRK